MMALRVVLLACALAACCQAAKLRGLDPQLRVRYAGTDGKFTCLDGRSTIPFAQVNDDYCDCVDGSDEPGTSACSNGKFYCKNVGHEPLRLNASMVDDGVCDCCDGTDEAPGRCPNRCKELGAESLRDLEASIAAAEAGVRAKEKYIAQAGGLKAEWKKKAEELEVQIQDQQARVDAAQGKRDELQQQESKLQEQKRAVEEEARKAEEAPRATAEPEPAAPAAPTEDEAAPEAAAPPADGGEGGDAAAAAAAGAGEEGQPEGQAEGQAAEETPEELARRIAAQWIPGARKEEGGAEEQPPAEAEAEGEGEGEEGLFAGEAEGEEPEAPLDEVDEDGLDPALPLDDGDDLYPHDDLEDSDLAGDEGEPGEEEEEPLGEEEEEGEAAASPPPAEPAVPRKELRLPAWARKAKAFGETLLRKVLRKPEPATAPAPEAAAPAAPKTELDKELDEVKKRLSEARSEYHRVERRLKDLKSERDTLKANLGREYGPQDEYAPLVDKCFEAQVDKYTYEVCPFKKAAQKEGHSSTGLGSWGGFGEGYSSMKFTGGQGCWQGPSRSMTVSLHCGATEALTHVEEPSRCEYHAELATPAACTAEALAALREQLAAKRRLLEAGPEEHDEL